MAGRPPSIMKRGLEHGSVGRDAKRQPWEKVDLRNGQEAIPADDEPDPAQGSRTLN